MVLWSAAVKRNVITKVLTSFELVFKFKNLLKKLKQIHGEKNEWKHGRDPECPHICQ